MLEVCLCKPAIYRLKILSGAKFESYKSMGGMTKREGEPNFQSSVGEAKEGGITIFDLNFFFGGGTFEKTMHLQI